jgi:hypothetical protein
VDDAMERLDAQCIKIMIGNCQRFYFHVPELLRASRENLALVTDASGRRSATPGQVGEAERRTLAARRPLRTVRD